MWCMTVFLRQWNLDQGPLLSAEQTKTAEPRDVPISDAALPVSFAALLSYMSPRSELFNTTRRTKTSNRRAAYRGLNRCG